MKNEIFLSTSSAGTICGYSLREPEKKTLFRITQAHEGNIHDMKAVDREVFLTCSTDGIKIWDLRDSHARLRQQFTNSKSSEFLSLATSGNMIAAGAALQGVDAELHIWDLRNTKDPIKLFVDSHHDDIMAIEFHPTLEHYLMSGSTDGYVNIYNLDEKDEDEALHQVINFGSVHSCHFTRKNRISVLSHYETLAFYELNNRNYEKVDEPTPHDLGDVREIWPDCQYLVDVFLRGYIAYGSNLQKKLALVPFNPITEKICLQSTIWFPGAHDEEVVRDLLVYPEFNMSVSCGEDGTVKCWKLPTEIPTFEIEPKSSSMAGIATGKLYESSSKGETTEQRPKSNRKETKKKHLKRFKPY